MTVSVQTEQDSATDRRFTKQRQQQIRKDKKFQHVFILSNQKYYTLVNVHISQQLS